MKVWEQWRDRALASEAEKAAIQERLDEALRSQAGFLRWMEKMVSDVQEEAKAQFGGEPLVCDREPDSSAEEHPRLRSEYVTDDSAEETKVSAIGRTNE